MKLPLSPCVLLTVICEAELEHDLLRDLAALGAGGYTVTAASGRGSRGVRDGAWPPGANIRVEVLCAEQTAAAIVEYLERRYYADYAMVVFLCGVSVLRAEKFSP